MATMAQAVTTSVSPATNQREADPAATAVAPVAALGSDTSRSQDTVNLTETGGRNVSIAGQNGKPQPAFQVTYFPPTVAQGAAAQPTAAVLAPANGPTTQGTNAALAAATASGPTNTAVAAATPQASLLSAASQAKLQQLDQVLQRLGINPTQISFAERIALLPLVNDPAAIQQYVQGLPTETAVLNPATSQVLAPAVTAQQNAPARHKPKRRGLRRSASGRRVARLAARSCVGRERLDGIQSRCDFRFGGSRRSGEIVGCYGTEGQYLGLTQLAGASWPRCVVIVQHAFIKSFQ